MTSCPEGYEIKVILQMNFSIKVFWYLNHFLIIKCAIEVNETEWFLPTNVTKVKASKFDWDYEVKNITDGLYFKPTEFLYNYLSNIFPGV